MSKLTNVITLDGYQYAVKINSYNRSWVRQFNSSITAGIIRVTFIDRGPGIQIYKMSLELRSWPTSSLPYKLGVTQTWDQQLTNLEASYNKTRNSLQFIDPFGDVPYIPGTSTNSGVYFLDYLQTIPPYATPDKPSIQAMIELQNAAFIVGPTS